MPDEPSFGFWSVMPPLVAIVMAMATRRVVISLALGIVVGAAIFAQGRPLDSAREFYGQLAASLIDFDHVRVFAFTLLMGSMVGVIHRGGGMHGVVDALAPLARNRRRGQMTTWLLGLIVFFDDYANTLLLGGTMQPLADRLRISRQKLAYLVDSTAAPVAGLVIVSTWVAGEIGYIADGLSQTELAATANPFALLLATIPYRFYVLLAIVFVGLVALSGRDFGPMLTAERAALTTTGAGPNRWHRKNDPSLAPDADTPRRWQFALLPIAVTVLAIVGLLFATGYLSHLGQSPGWGEMFANGDSYWALLGGSMLGWIVALLLLFFSHTISLKTILLATLRGGALMLPALMILWMAWTLSAMCGKLQTGSYLAGLIGQGVPPFWLPTLSFLLAAAVAFSTGTSWGTMGLLTPLVIQVTCKILAQHGEVAADDPLLLAATGSVLAGAIFGDHCSPISDTTVLSSQACGCDHIEHVWTQLPYALAVALVSICCGTIPVGLGASVWLMVAVAIGALALVVWLLGRDPESDTAAEAEP